jgi:outer membrane protein assembly factor BamB
MSMPRLALCVLALNLAPLCGAITFAGEPDVVTASGIKAGLCVHLGVTDGKLTAELAGGGKFVVHGLTSDPASVDKARKYILAKGLYGQVAVERSALKSLPYAENLVNLLVADDLARMKALDLKEVARVLAPNGAFCFKGNIDAAKLKAAGLGTAKASGGWSVALKPWPKDMDGWPSFDYGPAGNPVSKDTAVGPGTSLRWRVPMYSRHCVDVFRTWVSAGGRMFYSRRKLLPDGYRVRMLLVARDAFNGQLLWQQPVKWMIGSKYGDRNVLATADRLYLPLETKGPVVALDAASGKLLQTYAGTGRPDQLMLVNGKLIGASWRSSWAVDVKTGRRLWSQPKIGGQFVFAEGQLLFGNVYARPRQIVSLNPDDGKVKWKANGGGCNKYNNPFYYKGTLVLVKGAGGRKSYGLTVEGYSTKDGKKLWGGIPESNSILRRGGCYMGEVFGAQGLVWIHAVVKKDPARKNAGKRPSAWLGVDPGTGEVKKRYDDATSDPSVSRMLAKGTHRCNRGRATERGYLFGTFEFYEWETGKYHVSSATRSHCGIGTGILPANGLIYAPPPTCVCQQFMQRGGFSAFAHRPGGVKDDDAGRLIKGSGSSGTAGTAAPGDWSCYRKNAARLGASETEIPAGATQLWESQIGDIPTAPTIAGGRVLVASEVDHCVRALDAATGKALWRFTAGGRIDSPPTISDALAVFGCRDGWVYCLNAASGKLVWKYRVAPVEERVMVDGQLESPWPVHGSAVVVKGIVYAAAGWHTALDGGVTLTALKAGSGALVWKRRLERLPRNADVPVALLTSDGKYLCMGRKSFDLATGAEIQKARRSRVVSFGLSSFRDSDWAQSSNSKGRLRWGDGRASGELLSSGRALTCGISVKMRGRDDGSLMGAGAHRLFGSKGKGQPGWSVTVPLLPRAAVLAGKHFFAAGSPDPELAELKEIKDYRRRLKLGAELMEKRGLPQGGELWVLSAADGKKLHTLKLAAPPVFDGMAAAGGKLYLSTQDGKLRCFGKK